MPQRICPKCKSNLYNSSYYFCSFCGEALSDDLVLKPKFDKVKEHSLSKKIIKSQFIQLPKVKFNKYAVFSLSSIVFILVGTYVTYKIPIFKLNLEIFQGKISSPLLRAGNSHNVLYFKTDSPSEPFTFSDVTSYLPYETDLFIEINNLKELSKVFAYNLLPFNSISEISEKAFLSHSIQEGKDAWIILLPVKKDDSATLKFTDNFLHSYWKASLNDTFLIITSDGSLFNLVKDIKSQKAKSLDLNPQFQKSLESLPKSGSIMVVILNANGRKQFEDFSTYYKNQQFLNLMDETIKTGYNNFILKGYK